MPAQVRFGRKTVTFAGIAQGDEAVQHSGDHNHLFVARGRCEPLGRQLSKRYPRSIRSYEERIHMGGFVGQRVLLLQSREIEPLQELEINALAITREG